MSWLPTDEHITNPNNQYAVSKLSQELAALKLGNLHKIPTIILRYSIVQGPRQSFRNSYSGVLRIFSQLASFGKDISYYEDGNQLRDYISIYDVVNANIFALESNELNFDIRNVGGSQPISIREYANLVGSAINPNIDLRPSGYFRYGDARNVVSDINKLQSLGWKPENPIAMIIQGYVDWATLESDWGDYYSIIEKELIRHHTLFPIHQHLSRNLS